MNNVSNDIKDLDIVGIYQFIDDGNYNFLRNEWKLIVDKIAELSNKGGLR